MKKRIINVFFIFCIGFLLLCSWLAYIASNPYYLAVSKNQSTRILSQTTKRGTIYDTHHKPLVNQTSTYSAGMVVTPENVHQVHQLTNLSKQELDEKLRQGTPFLHTILTPTVDDPNILPFETYTRSPSYQVAPHLVGYLSDGVGMSGIEKALNDRLNEMEQSVSISYQLDGIGRPQPHFPPQLTTAGSGGGVVLTLDLTIQRIVQQMSSKLDRGAIVVMEIDTGKLRAVSSFPSFQHQTLSQDIKKPYSPMINRAFTPMSVGSSFKVAIASAALEQKIPPSTKYTCTGSYQLGPTVIRCHHSSGHGEQTMSEALANSCNPWFVHVGLQLNLPQLLSVVRSLSFGKSTELAPGFYTQAGKLPSSSMSKGQLANFSFGQGELLATPVQIAQMISAVANQGITPTPSLVEGFITEDKHWLEQYDTPLGIQALSQKNANLLKNYLIATNDTDQEKANPTYTTAGGKTSTAQTGIFENGKELYLGWYSGFVPAKKPKYAIVVVSENAISGNNDASPIFAEIADQLFLAGKITEAKPLEAPEEESVTE